MGSYYEIDTAAVYDSGKSIKGLEPDMLSAGTQAFQAIADAGGIAHHPQVVAALNAYHDTHVKDAHALAAATGDCGVKLGKTGSSFAHAENDMTGQHGAATAVAQSDRSALSRAL